VIVIFFARGEKVFSQGIFGKHAGTAWCFCGEGVVICVARVVLLHHVSGRRKIRHLSNFLFCFLLGAG
jgi:hypothetical protein